MLLELQVIISYGVGAAGNTTSLCWGISNNKINNIWQA